MLIFGPAPALLLLKYESSLPSKYHLVPKLLNLVITGAQAAIVEWIKRSLTELAARV